MTQMWALFIIWTSQCGVHTSSPFTFQNLPSFSFQEPLIPSCYHNYSLLIYIFFSLINFPWICSLPNLHIFAFTFPSQLALDLNQLLPLWCFLLRRRVPMTSVKPLSLLQSSSFFMIFYTQYCTSFQNWLLFWLAKPHTILVSLSLSILYLFLFVVFPSPAPLTIGIVFQNSILGFLLFLLLHSL